MKPVRFHDAARVELVNEVLYYASISPRLGEALAAAVEKAALLASEFPEILQVPLVNERLTAMGSTPVGSSPEDFARFLNDDSGKWTSLMTKAGIPIPQ